MKTVSLFSGCGGSDLGAKQAGADIVFAVDIARNAVLTYKAHRDLLAAPDCDVRQGDIAELSFLPSCELLLGCYPCQSFSMGGRRRPDSDSKAMLYQEFARCLTLTDARFAVVENVAGLAWLDGGRHLQQHLARIACAGRGYVATHAVLNAENFGVPARRRRLFLVFVRSDLGVYYHFPRPTHGPHSVHRTPFQAHGDVIEHLPADPQGEYYTRESGSFSWWYMSRNRKRPWREPSYTILGNWRHTPLHPASPTMRLVSSDLANGWRQTWEFTDEYDHLDVEGRIAFEQPRRLSWREAACLQTFPDSFEPKGSVASKFAQIGDAVPPRLMQAIVSGIVTGKGLSEEPPSGSAGQVWSSELTTRQPDTDPR